MKKHYFDDEWKHWIWSNIHNGVTKQRIYDDLIENDYDPFAVMNELRFIPEIYRKKDEINPNQVIDHIERSGATRIEASIPLYLYENFLTEFECNEIIALQRKKNTQSTTGDGKDCNIDPTRTSFTTSLDPVIMTNQKELVLLIKEKILMLTGIPAQYSETLQAQWYQKEGYYNDHFDACDKYEQFKHHHGNRTWTCMITLNEVEEGGETYFPKLDITITPKPGQAIIWYNLADNGLAHPDTVHTGKHVIKGEKFIITQWFHQCAEN